MSTTKQLKVYKGLPTTIKSRARGLAVTLNCFANSDTSVVLTPDNNYNGTYLGTVNIQAHTAYNYDADTGELILVP